VTVELTHFLQLLCLSLPSSRRQHQISCLIQVCCSIRLPSIVYICVNVWQQYVTVAKVWLHRKFKCEVCRQKAQKLAYFYTDFAVNCMTDDILLCKSVKIV